METYNFLDLHNRIEEIKDKNIYLYGASDDYSLIELLLVKGLHPIAAYDSDSAKIDTLYYNQVPVLNASDIKQLLLDETAIIIINSNSYYSIQISLLNKGVPKDRIFCRDTVRNFFDKIDGKYVLNFLDLCITQKCSLNCKNCSNLMQYYRKKNVVPLNFNIKQILSSVKNLLDHIDQVNNLLVLGGEPFVHPELDKILSELIKYDQIKQISILTNATIIPKDTLINILKNEKILINASVYPASKNAAQLIRVLQNNNIRHIVRNLDIWYDPGEIKHRSLSPQELSNTYNSCCMKHRLTLQENKIYPCAVSYHGVALGMIEENANEIIDLSAMTTQEFITSMTRLFNLELLQSCNYCERPWTREIVAAEQDV